MKLKRLTKCAFIAALMMIATSCAQTEKADATTEKAQVAVSPTGDAMKIRYIDEDSLLAKYNLAKDLSESNLKLSNKFDAAQQQRATEINKFASEVQRKYQNNGYLTEESFNVDQQKPMHKTIWVVCNAISRTK